MKKIPFVKENISATRTKEMQKTKSNLKDTPENLTLCVIGKNYDQHCLSDNVSDKDIRAVLYAYIKETGEDWTIEYYTGELTEKQLEEGMRNILSNPHKYKNQQLDIKN